MSTPEPVDMSDSIIPRSDQQNFDDYLAGPRTVSIERVTRGSAEQPIEIHLVEYPGRPYKPSKSMRRVLVSAWGPDASTYAGRRMRLYGDPDVKFGGQTVGGIKISHLSHIDKPMAISLTETRGKRKTHRIEPLPDAPPSTSTATPITDDMITEFERDIASAASLDELDVVADELKACDLGTHRQRLLAMWTDRRKVVKAKPQDGA